MSRYGLFVTLLFSSLLGQSCFAEPVPKADGGRLVRLGEERFDFPQTELGPRIFRPYFDEDGRLRFSDAPVHGRATGACDTEPPRLGPGGRPLYPRHTVLLSPRVDERRCLRGTRPGTDITLLGIGADGEVTWQRSLEFISGSRRLDRRLIGAGPEGLVLSDLEVWSPATGETLVPGRTHPVPGEDRSVPDHQVDGRALYHPELRRIFLFDAEASLLDRRGGLYVFDPASSERELIAAISAGPTGTYDRVEDMALGPAGRYLVLGERLAVRGPSSVSIALFDLDTRRLVFLERHGEGSSCSNPTVVTHRGGEVGFSYRDANQRQYVLVRYRLEP